jgi:energy-coupling factor transport system permease protein
MAVTAKLSRTLAPRLPRALHPVAWWLWAVALAVAASRTTNPLLLLLILAVAGVVVSARRTEAPWARGFRYYLMLALIVIAIRLVFRVVFTTPPVPGQQILFRLPHVSTPSWYAGIHLGGPIATASLLSAAVDGMRLATLICCIGAANVLANPKRALRVLPGALYELGTAVVVAISVAPQLIESAQRVSRARRLRGGGRGFRALRSIIVPVLEDALDRSLHLAASMDSRGYGRTNDASTAGRRVTASLLITGLFGLCVGCYGVLAGTVSGWLGYPSLLAGTALCGAGLIWGSRRTRRTRYRPDAWLGPEWIVVGCGVLCAAVFCAGIGYPAVALNPSFDPPHWPPLPLIPTLAVLIAALPAVLAPPPLLTPRTRVARTDAQPRPAQAPTAPIPERIRA